MDLQASTRTQGVDCTVMVDGGEWPRAKRSDLPCLLTRLRALALRWRNLSTLWITPS